IHEWRSSNDRDVERNVLSWKNSLAFRLSDHNRSEFSDTCIVCDEVRDINWSIQSVRIWWLVRRIRIIESEGCLAELTKCHVHTGKILDRAVDLLDGAGRPAISFDGRKRAVQRMIEI